jgi:hypothetical protein
MRCRRLGVTSMARSAVRKSLLFTAPRAVLRASLMALSLSAMAAHVQAPSATQPLERDSARVGLGSSSCEASPEPPPHVPEERRSQKNVAGQPRQRTTVPNERLHQRETRLGVAGGAHSCPSLTHTAFWVSQSSHLSSTPSSLPLHTPKPGGSRRGFQIAAPPHGNETSRGHCVC